MIFYCAVNLYAVVTVTSDCANLYKSEGLRLPLSAARLKGAEVDATGSAL